MNSNQKLTESWKIQIRFIWIHEKIYDSISMILIRLKFIAIADWLEDILTEKIENAFAIPIIICDYMNLYDSLNIIRECINRGRVQSRSLLHINITKMKFKLQLLRAKLCIKFYSRKAWRRLLKKVKASRKEYQKLYGAQLNSLRPEFVMYLY